MRQKIFWCVLGIFWHVAFASFGGKFDGQDPYAVGQEGENFYEEGNYKEASPRLKFALERGETNFAASYAHICKQELDEEKHTLREAAYWYLVAEASGDPDVYAMLRAYNPTLVDREKDQGEKIEQLKQIWRVKGRVYYANEGSRLHFEGVELPRAYRYLKRASQGYHPLAQTLYAETCLGQHDGKFHRVVEASMWYVLAAKGGDPDADAFLRTVPEVLPPYGENTIRCVTSFWVLSETLRNFQPLRPSFVNDYLMFRDYSPEMTAVAAQKIPYFFDKLLNALLWEVHTHGFSCFQEPLVAQGSQSDEEAQKGKRPKTCREEAHEGCHGISVQVAPWQYGLVYESYWKSLKDQSGGRPQKPSKEPKVSALCAFILDSYGTHLSKEKSSKAWSEQSHGEYPWIWAAIKYWKHHPANQGKSFNVGVLTEERLLETLENCEPIDGDTLQEVIRIVEKDPNIWPNGDSFVKFEEVTGETKEAFQQRILNFFQSDVSRSDPFIQQVIDAFRKKVQRQELNLTLRHDREIFETPLLMHLTQQLVITGVTSTKKDLDLLKEAGRYFSNMERLEVIFAKKIKKDDVGKQLIELLRKMAKKGIEVSYDGKNKI